MVKLTFEVPDDIDTEFRKVVAERKGLHKGVLGEAYTEAIMLWIQQGAKKHGRA